jgi:hypothetical protein
VDYEREVALESQTSLSCSTFFLAKRITQVNGKLMENVVFLAGAGSILRAGRI